MALKPGQCDQIRDMRRRGYTVTEIARRFDVTEQTVRNVVTGRTHNQKGENHGTTLRSL